MLTTAVPHTFAAREIIYREASSGWYSRAAGIAAAVLVEIVYVVAGASTFTPIFYFMTGFDAAAGKYFTFWLTTILVGVTYTYGGMMLAGVLGNQIVAMVLGGMSMACYFLFGGVVIRPADIPVWWKWFYYIDFESWAVRALAVDQFYCDAAANPACPTILVPAAGGGAVVDRYEFLAAGLEFHYPKRWEAVAILAAITFVYAAITVGAFKALNFLRR